LSAKRNILSIDSGRTIAYLVPGKRKGLP
jgi:hypothetical protein